MTRKILCNICGFDMNTSLNRQNHIDIGIYKGIGEAQYFAHLQWDLCISCTRKVMSILGKAQKIGLKKTEEILKENLKK